MKGRLRPYPSLKPTGLPWLGEVPAHWEVRRIKTLLREVDVRSARGDERLLSLRMGRGPVDHLAVGGKPIPPAALIGFRVVEPGQIVMNRMRAARGLVGVANVRGPVSPDYAVFAAISEAFTPYLLELFRSPALGAVFRAESKGLGNGDSGFLRLYSDRFGIIGVPQPPLGEQRSIVRFLDWHGAQTGRLIRAKKKLIALLGEQKQAIIHRAITRGLDPNAKLKPSGVPWLGDVPEGWEVVSLSSMSVLIQTGPFGSQRSASSYANGGVPIINPSHIRDGLVVPDSGVAVTPSEAANLSRHQFALDDIVLARRGELGRCAKICPKEAGWICGTGSIKLRLKKEHLTLDYGVRLLGDTEIRAALKLASIGTTIDNLNEGMIGRLKLAIPSLKEQEKIEVFASKIERQFNILSDDTRREVTLIQELRARLIADAVTGKLDVRALAAGLPETIADEAIDTLADDDDLDEAQADTEDEEVAA